VINEVRVGLVGFGMAGQVFHAPVIDAVAGLKLAKVVERHGESSRARYPWVEIERDVTALLDDEAIDLIVVATPNSSHFDLTRRALLANKHVVVDKPFTAESAQAQELIDLARQKGRVLSVFHNRRWDGDFQTVKKLVETGYLGRLVEYEAHFDRFRNSLRPNTWKEKKVPGTGVLFDLGSHLVDQAQTLFGLPEMITADIRVQRDQGEIDDQFEVMLHYPGLKVTLQAGMLVREQGPRFTLHGTEGSFVKYGIDPQEEALKRGSSPVEPDWGLEPEEHWGTLNTQIGGLHFDGKIETFAGRYQAFYENIYNAIAHHEDLVVKPEEARNTIRIIELALESNERRCTVAYS
jgi:scyllo-inositol 2-dehydrogenase (NADP+)